MEHWIPVPGYQGFYEVSDHGNVRSVDVVQITKAGWARSKKGRLLKQSTDRYGRNYVDLCINYKYERYYIHRLVLAAFVGPCPNNMEACHNDGNHMNNNLENLRWDTHANNLLDKIAHGTLLRGERLKQSKITADDVKQIRNLRIQGLSHKEIASRYNISREAVGRICRMENWAHVS